MDFTKEKLLETLYKYIKYNDIFRSITEEWKSERLWGSGIGDCQTEHLEEKIKEFKKDKRKRTLTIKLNHNEVFHLSKLIEEYHKLAYTIESTIDYVEELEN
jgi:hypothetical protein